MVENEKVTLNLNDQYGGVRDRSLRRGVGGGLSAQDKSKVSFQNAEGAALDGCELPNYLRHSRCNEIKNSLFFLEFLLLAFEIEPICWPETVPATP